MAAQARCILIRVLGPAVQSLLGGRGDFASPNEVIFDLVQIGQRCTPRAAMSDESLPSEPAWRKSRFTTR